MGMTAIITITTPDVEAIKLKVDTWLKTLSDDYDFSLNDEDVSGNAWMYKKGSNNTEIKIRGLRVDDLDFGDNELVDLFTPLAQSFVEAGYHCAGTILYNCEDDELDIHDSEIG